MKIDEIGKIIIRQVEDGGGHSHILHFFPNGTEFSGSFPSALSFNPITLYPRPPHQIPPVGLETGFCVPPPKNSGEL